MSTAWASDDCGTRISHENTRWKRIIGGNNVTVGKWPWQVMVDDGKGVCGGTIISSQWILTAAHCLVDKEKEAVDEEATIAPLSVIVAVDHAPDNEFESNVIEAVTHPDYFVTPYENDIALLKLNEPLIFNGNVATICLPNSDQSIPDDGLAVAVGYGAANYRGMDTNETVGGQLQETILPIIRGDICEERFKEGFGDWISNVTYYDKILCAGSMGHGTAPGDSGGPLMMKAIDGRWFQIGITSFGENTYEGLIRADEYPGAFTDVRKYCDWIEETTGGEASCQEELVDIQDVEIHV